MKNIEEKSDIMNSLKSIYNNNNNYYYYLLYEQPLTQLLDESKLSRTFTITAVASLN